MRIWRKEAGNAPPKLDAQGRSRIYLKDGMDAAKAGDLKALPMFAVAGDFPKIDRTFHLALAAVAEALADAGLSVFPPGFRLGVCLGTTVACQLNDIGFYREYRATGNPALEPVERFAAGSLAERVARRLGTDGPALTVVNAC